MLLSRRLAIGLESNALSKVSQGVSSYSRNWPHRLKHGVSSAVVNHIVTLLSVFISRGRGWDLGEYAPSRGDDDLNMGPFRYWH